MDILAHSIRDQDVTPELVAEMKQKNVSLHSDSDARSCRVRLRDHTRLPEGSFLPAWHVALQGTGGDVTAPEWQEKVRKDPTARDDREARSSRRTRT